MSERRWVWSRPEWPANVRWDAARLLEPLAEARRVQGEFLGRVDGLGEAAELEAAALRLTEEAVETAAVEGVAVDREAARSSVARRLGLPSEGRTPPSRATDGLVEVLVDATRNAAAPLTEARLLSWHAALFPTGYSGMQRVRAGAWRTAAEPMQVVSGRPGREHVHYEAPPARHVPSEMTRYLAWVEDDAAGTDALLHAGEAYFRFVTIHPFDDGNGRVGRAITDLLLARDETPARHLYSLSRQVHLDQRAHHDGLEAAQRGDGDITEWLAWFLGCLTRAIGAADETLESVLATARFWRAHAGASLNDRQRKVLTRLLDAGRAGFEGGLTTRKYAHLANTSRATAQRDLAELLDAGLIVRLPGGGRSTSYAIAWP